MDRLEKAITRVVDRMVAVYQRELRHEEEAYKVSQQELRRAFEDAVAEDDLDGFAAQHGQAELDHQFQLSLKRVSAQWSQ